MVKLALQHLQSVKPGSETCNMAPENTVPDAMQLGSSKTDVRGAKPCSCVEKAHQEPTGVEKDKESLVNVGIPVSVQMVISDSSVGRAQDC